MTEIINDAPEEFEAWANELKNKLIAIENAVGTEAIVRKTMEECAELAQACNKWLEGGAPEIKASGELAISRELYGLYDEMTDVLVCVNHMLNLSGISRTAIFTHCEEKIDRAYRRSVNE